MWQLTQDSSYTALALAPTSLTVFKNAGDEVRIQIGAGTTIQRDPRPEVEAGFTDG